MWIPGPFGEDIESVVANIFLVLAFACTIPILIMLGLDVVLYLLRVPLYLYTSLFPSSSTIKQ